MPNDRDSSIDAMLRARRGEAAPPGLCLDAETLAAWMEGELPADARAAAERHAASCARCQALLAAMVRTSPEVEAVPRHRWWRAGWLVPLGAVAAAMLVWIAVGRQSDGVAPSLRAPASSRAAAEVSLGAPPAAEPQSKSPLKDEASSRAVAAPAAGLSSPRPGAPPQTARTAPLEDAKLAKTTEAADRMAGGTVGAPAPPPRTNYADTIAAVPSLPAEPLATPAAPSLRTPGASAAESVHVTAESPTRSALTGGAAIRAGGVAESVTAQSAARSAMTGAGPEAPPLVDIISPDPKARWRLIGPTTIERSIDGGVSWTPQTIGVAPFGFATQGTPSTAPPWTAGSSPAPDVCWIAGRRGMVLVSTNGTTWQLRRLLEAVDLIAIQAVDARTASVTTADGRRFATADGGISWVQVSARPPAERE